MLKNGYIFIARIHTFYDLKCQQLKQYYDEERTGREPMGGCREGEKWHKNQQKMGVHYDNRKGSLPVSLTTWTHKGFVP
jgi:hypothetical protein